MLGKKTVQEAIQLHNCQVPKELSTRESCFTNYVVNYGSKLNECPETENQVTQGTTS